MARISLAQTSAGPRNFYNLTQAVGPGAPNQREDVLLVPYFLRENFKTSKFAGSPFPGVLKIDGVAGQQTFAAILHYQKTMKKDGSTIATDGRVDPAIAEQIRGSISNTQYTILFLNLGYKSARPSDWPRVSLATDCPAELRPKIKEPEFV